MAANKADGGPAAELVPGRSVGGRSVRVGNANGELFAVSRHCRHLGADVANGSIVVETACCVPGTAPLRRRHRPHDPWASTTVHQIPVVDAGYRQLTPVLPLGRGDVVECGAAVFVRNSTASSTGGEMPIFAGCDRLGIGVRCRDSVRASLGGHRLIAAARSTEVARDDLRAFGWARHARLPGIAHVGCSIRATGGANVATDSALGARSTGPLVRPAARSSALDTPPVRGGDAPNIGLTRIGRRGVRR